MVLVLLYQRLIDHWFLVQNVAGFLVVLAVLKLLLLTGLYFDLAVLGQVELDQTLHIDHIAADAFVLNLEKFVLHLFVLGN